MNTSLAQYTCNYKTMSKPILLRLQNPGLRRNMILDKPKLNIVL